MYFVLTDGWGHNVCADGVVSVRVARESAVRGDRVPPARGATAAEGAPQPEGRPSQAALGGLCRQGTAARAQATAESHATGTDTPPHTLHTYI